MSVLAAMASLAATASAQTVTPAGRTVVSLTFDDGQQTQYLARKPLAQHGMHATFYVNSGYLAQSTKSTFRMPRSRLHDLARDGNEIGGHTLLHVDLTTQSPADQRRAICDDRASLRKQGFSPVVSFAYPLGAHDADVERVAASCGYTSARRTGGLRGASSCGNCPFAETFPPQDPFSIRVPSDPEPDLSLEALQTYVTRAEANGGGWVPIMMHSVCNACDPGNQSIRIETFRSFLDWLAPRAANGTVVQTVGEVMGGGPATTTDHSPPKSSIRCALRTCRSRYSGAVTLALRARDSQSGVERIRYTINGKAPTARRGRTYSAPFAIRRSSVIRFRAFDNAGNRERTRTLRLRIG